MRQARTALAEHRARVEAARKEVDFLRHAVEELAALDPKPGEETELAERRTLMQQGEKVARELNEALDAVAARARRPPISRPRCASSSAAPPRRRGSSSRASTPSTTRSSLLDEARTSLEDALQAAEFDPRELERVEERLFGLRAAARKYNVAVDDLAALRGRYEGDVAVIDAGEEALGRLEATLATADAAYLEKAEALSKGRRKAASALDKAVQAELPPLKLERARFITEIATDPEARDPAGLDRVEFWAQTNPGTRPGPMMKVASGGELSRFMLALKVVLADKGSAPTLIFDEIDTGVGGAVADAIGARLARLSAGSRPSRSPTRRRSRPGPRRIS